MPPFRPQHCLFYLTKYYRTLTLSCKGTALYQNQSWSVKETRSLKKFVAFLFINFSPLCVGSSTRPDFSANEKFCCFKKWKLQNELQHNSGSERPQEVSSPVSYSQQLRAEARPGCSVPHPVRAWKTPRIDTTQTLQASYALPHSPYAGNIFHVSSLNFFQFRPAVHHCEESGCAF